MLDERFASLLTIRTRDDLRSQAVKFARWLGFDTICVLGVQDRPVGDSLFVRVENIPSDYRGIFESARRGRNDPVMQHCKHRGTPIVWGRDIYLANDRMDFWEEQAPFGFRSGIALALHLPGGRHFFAGVDRDQDLPADSADITRATAYLHLFVSVAQEVGLEALFGAAQPATEKALSDRERECLRWTVDGKTAWEVGRILGISEQTVAKHLHRATRKLDCVNKHHAVVKALRLGLIR